MYNKICVAVRKRPLNQKEFGNGDNDVVECAAAQSLVVCEPKVKYDLTKYVERHNFVFDEVLDADATNLSVYKRTAAPLVETVCSGGTATCFAYGQTGSGKTYTMLGGENDPGLFLYAAMDMFKSIASQGLNVNVMVCFYEIYAGKLFDLLNNRNKLVAREDADQRVNICGVSEHNVKDETELMQIIQTGSQCRASGATSANADSSRSHAIFQIDLRSVSNNKNHGRLCFVDLAGNERGADTANCDRHTRMEGAEINKSLLALKECIRALGMGKNHIPFRGSVLTEVLKDCFSAQKCRTVMIATVSPSSGNCEHTLNTLRYSDRVKEIRKGGGGGAAAAAAAAQIPQQQQQQQPAAVKPPVRASKDQPANKPKKQRPQWQGVLEADVEQIIQNHRQELDDNENVMADESDDTDAEAEAVHAHLVNSLRREENEITAFHRQHIDNKMACVRAEVAAVQYMDLPRSNIEEYVSRVDAELAKEQQMIQEMRQRLHRIQTHLKEEEVLSRTFTPHFHA
eukprot:PhM_4_TR1720/c0_g1_i1/m.89262/K10393/KIF2_24, MCAK; kinesin family member 2/24